MLELGALLAVVAVAVTDATVVICITLDALAGWPTHWHAASRRVVLRMLGCRAYQLIGGSRDVRN